MIITLDGPAGVGKSTAARLLAGQLNIAFLDTGATYRAATLNVMRRDLDWNDTDALAAATTSAHIQLSVEAGTLQVLLDGDDISDAIRDPQVTRHVHHLASQPAVRDVLVDLQRRIGAELGSFVAEGRDQGSVVFPDATVKFFLDADPAIRAQRRYDELAAAGKTVDFDALLAELIERDDADRNRSVAPLIVPDGATLIDTSGKTIDQVQAELLTTVEANRCR
jgi:cytidylate kinase